jgi:uncharacterized protein (TIGR03084 family)
VRVDQLCDDLQAERADLLGLLDPLGDDAWRTATPAPGWAIVDQATHLAWFDEAAGRAITDPDGFRAERGQVLADVDGFVDAVARRHHDRPGGEVLAWMRSAGDRLDTAARAADPSVRVPWYGPDMSVASSITARIMETWAHGQDVADALGVRRDPSPRLPHVAFLGWRAVANSFRVRGRPVPAAPVRVEAGEVVLGPEDAVDVVRGSLLDLCLVVTQRRHPADTDLVAEGPVATEWLAIAQAFAGPPGPGRRPEERP